MLQRSARSLFLERVGTYFSGFSKRQWVYAGSAAYAAVTIGFFLISGMGGSNGTPDSAASIAGANAASTGALVEKHLLWDEMKIVIEDDAVNQQIADRRYQTSRAQWDPAVLPASSRGFNATFAPAKSEEQEPEKDSATLPVGLSL